MKIKRFNEELYSPHAEYWVVIEYDDGAPATVSIFPDKNNAENYVLKCIFDMSEGDAYLTAWDAMDAWNKNNTINQIDMFDARMKVEPYELPDEVKQLRIQNRFDL